jgi:hypothetical protein
VFHKNFDQSSYQALISCLNKNNATLDTRQTPTMLEIIFKFKKGFTPIRETLLYYLSFNYRLIRDPDFDFKYSFVPINGMIGILDCEIFIDKLIIQIYFISIKKDKLCPFLRDCLERGEDVLEQL